jgi:hypothetical protein
VKITPYHVSVVSVVSGFPSIVHRPVKSIVMRALAVYMAVTLKNRRR